MVQIVNKNDHVPAIFLVVDHKQNFSVLSLFNAGPSIFEFVKQMSDISFINPICKIIEFKKNDEVNLINKGY